MFEHIELQLLGYLAKYFNLQSKVIDNHRYFMNKRLSLILQ